MGTETNRIFKVQLLKVAPARVRDCTPREWRGRIAGLPFLTGLRVCQRRNRPGSNEIYHFPVFPIWNGSASFRRESSCKQGSSGHPSPACRSMTVEPLPYLLFFYEILQPGHSLPDTNGARQGLHRNTKFTDDSNRYVIRHCGICSTGSTVAGSAGTTDHLCVPRISYLLSGA